MTADEIVKEIESLGSESYKKILRNHGIPEPVFGVKIEDLKKIKKKVKQDHSLALELYDTGIYDARYLAGMLAEDAKITKKDLQRWAKNANCGSLSEYTVAPIASGSPYGHELALEWIDSTKENIACAGWATLSGLVAIKDDSELDLEELKRLLERVQKTVHRQPNNVRYVMNGFVISVGCYVKALTDLAIQTAEKIGRVTVDMGNTACKVPFAPEYIRKVQERGTIGKKRKTMRC